MTYQEVAAMIDGIGLPNAYYQFTGQTEKPPPFVCFFFPESDDLFADNANYQGISRLVVELYTDAKSFGDEAAVEAALAAHGLSWHKAEEHIDEERLHLTAYDMEVVINGQ